MAKQATITEIAKRAGVSIGTVDRVLHNRSGVSEKSRTRIQAILDEAGYKPNIHTSAVALRKKYRIVITIPHSRSGGYWDLLLKGVHQAMDEYSDITIDSIVMPYDQFDPVSCRKTFDQIPDANPDAIILGPTFDAETHSLCKTLEEKGIPFILVDTSFPDLNPLAAFTADQPAGGSLIGSMLCDVTPAGSGIALITSHLHQDGKAQNAEQRRFGLLHYLQQRGEKGRLQEIVYDFNAGGEGSVNLERFFREHTEIQGACVLNSRGHQVADIIERSGRIDIRLIAFDLTEQNEERLVKGTITALISQRPEKQGFHAVTTLLEYLLYRKVKDQVHSFMPLDILCKENLPFYR